MYRLLFTALYLCFYFSLFGQGISSYSFSDIDSHLTKFSYYNITHHDNIDDEAHTHKHKHSENGEEHEHKHEHSQVAQNEIKVLNSIKIIEPIVYIEIQSNFYNKIFISNPHPLEIFRPPIV